MVKINLSERNERTKVSGRVGDGGQRVARSVPRSATFDETRPVGNVRNLPIVARQGPEAMAVCGITRGSYSIHRTKTDALGRKLNNECNTHKSEAAKADPC